MSDLPATSVARAVTMIEEGHTYRSVGRALGVSTSVVHRVVRRYRTTGSYVRRRGQGRNRSTSDVDDRFIVLQTLRNRRQTAVQSRNRLQEVRNVNVSERTVRRRLTAAGLKSYVPAKAPKLETAHRVARLAFAREHRNWTTEWSHVLFTDESRFCVDFVDGREKMWRYRGERYNQTHFTETVSYGGGSVMVWGGICLGGRTELVIIENGSLTAQRYVTDILEPHVMPFAPFIGDDFIFMHDNARPHTAHIVNRYLFEVGITKMNWPARSPDMNPIEHAWDILGRRVRQRNPAPRNVPDLKLALVEEWDNLPQELIDNLILNMGNRIQVLIMARGGNTRY